MNEFSGLDPVAFDRIEPFLGRAACPIDTVSLHLGSRRRHRERQTAGYRIQAGGLHDATFSLAFTFGFGLVLAPFPPFAAGPPEPSRSTIAWPIASPTSM